MKKARENLKRLEKKLNGHESEGVEIKVRENHPVSAEVKVLLEYKKRHYLFNKFHFY